MHETLANLLELHDVNRQRQVLIFQRRDREAKHQEAEQVLATAQAAREAAESAVGSSDALTRQYQADLERCSTTIDKLREQQMQAKTNKEYLACINGIENAKSEMKLRQESLAQLEEQIAEKRTAVEAAAGKEAEAKAALEALATAATETPEADVSESELDRMYQERKTKVDPKFLEVYERLISAQHKMPLMRVDGPSRATPMGNMISTQQLERLRLGHLVTDPSTNAILYVDEGK